VAGNCKISIDDDAYYRQAELWSQFDSSQATDNERMASNFGINFIELKGNIGILENGAGTALATIDMIEAQGGKAANFMDISGNALHEQVQAGFRILD